MSLEAYCRDKRPLVQKSSASVLEAVHALKNNNVGALMVMEGKKLVGIVTDRDLITRVVAGGLPPKETMLRDVMTPEPVTLPIDASERQAVGLMRAHHVRRIPVVDDGYVVGIVTLDDLLIAGAVDGENAGAIVESQLSEPAAAKPAGELYPMRLPPERRISKARHVAHAQQTLAGFKARLSRSLGVSDGERALAAFEIVISALAQLLAPAEGRSLASQLPWVLKQELLELPTKPKTPVSRESIESELCTALELDEETAPLLMQRVAATLHEFVGPTVVRQIVEQLPPELAVIFPDSFIPQKGESHAN